MKFIRKFAVCQCIKVKWTSVFPFGTSSVFNLQFTFFVYILSECVCWLKVYNNKYRVPSVEEIVIESHRWWSVNSSLKWANVHMLSNNYLLNWSIFPEWLLATAKRFDIFDQPITFATDQYLSNTIWNCVRQRLITNIQMKPYIFRITNKRGMQNLIFQYYWPETGLPEGVELWFSMNSFWLNFDKSISTRSENDWIWFPILWRIFDSNFVKN